MSTYLTICGFTFFANVNSSNFTVATQEIIKEFYVSQTQAGQLVCFNVFLFGVGNIFWVPLMRVIGKRPVYLVAMLALSMMNVWSSQAVSYNELLATRILSGFPAAAADATVPRIVALHDVLSPRADRRPVLGAVDQRIPSPRAGLALDVLLSRHRGWDDVRDVCLHDPRNLIRQASSSGFIVQN
jgi:predicted MFS family arabinose efflux permease